jgi:hypothetical protein
MSGAIRGEGLDASAEALVSRVITDCARNGFLEGETLAGKTNLLPLFLARLPELNTRVKKRVIEQALFTGCAPGQKQGRWICSDAVAEFLVCVLETSSDYLARSYAAEQLVARVPSVCIQPYGLRIVTAILNRPNLDSRIRLLGKTGCLRAREWLASDAQFVKEDSMDREMALARLGDLSLSRRFAVMYEEERDCAKRAELAGRLGYIGDAVCIMRLVRDIGNPSTYERGLHKVSIRWDIAMGLGEAFPEESVFRIDSARSGSEAEALHKRMQDWVRQYFSAKGIGEDLGKVGVSLVAPRAGESRPSGLREEADCKTPEGAWNALMSAIELSDKQRLRQRCTGNVLKEIDGVLGRADFWRTTRESLAGRVITETLYNNDKTKAVLLFSDSKGIVMARVEDGWAFADEYNSQNQQEFPQPKGNHSRAP